MNKKLFFIPAIGAVIGGIATWAARRKSPDTDLEHVGPIHSFKAVDVDVPVTTAYNQWTQFESFPQFMEGVKEIRQITDTRLHWRATVAGREEEFDAEITEQIPDKRIAWRSLDGPRHQGVATFHYLDDGHSRVALQLDVHPSGMVERVGTRLGMMDDQVARDLKRFKEFIEARGVETGAWRGTVTQEKASASV